MATRESLKETVDRLPEDVLDLADLALQRLLSMDTDPLWQALENAPFDDEPLDAKTIAALDAAQARLGRSRPAAAASKKS